MRNRRNYAGATTLRKAGDRHPQRHAATFICMDAPPRQISTQISRCLRLILLYDGIVTSVAACQIAPDPAQRLQVSQHVQTNSDRESGRDRLPDHQDCPPDGDRDGRGLFRGRP